MRLTSLITITSCVTLLGVGCGEGGSTANSNNNSDPGSPTVNLDQTGTMNARTTEVRSDLYAEVNVNVESVEILDVKGVWHTVGTVHRTVNLLAVDAEARALIDVNAKLAVGDYTKLRLKIDNGCTVRMLDGSIRELRIPGELSAGLVLDASITIRANAATQVFLGLDLSTCLQLYIDNGKPCYYLRPLITVVDSVLSGSIAGVVHGKASGELVANAKVFAEYFDDAGRPHIQATAFADAQGNFTFSALPLNRTYHLVCNPPSFGKGYKLFASAEIALDVNASAKVMNVDLDADPILNLSIMGTVSGAVTPAISLDGCDYLGLVEELACGVGCQKWFLIDHTTASIDAQESYGFKALGQGRYAVQTTRGRCVAGGICTWDALNVSSTVDLDLSLNLGVLLGIHL